MLAIAGQTPEPNGPEFIKKPLEYPGGNIDKTNFTGNAGHFS